ncbi:phage tail protein [Paenibacillus flagellatus]|uniref:Phage tail protein n=1 Tax=Paenibacillus flagellatus TaxID=2211139 RepID=A0A2V5KE00_9BACL|nr:tail fiber protein [Paenibacillus flagellatus]PYI56514.1 phage tail protein [Paenibacillus flagellatus]
MSDQYLGEIRMFAGNYAPQGWAMCNGQLLPISQNEALYSVIGTTYGGDGQTNFALPDMQGRLPVHMGTNPQTTTGFPIGQKGGTEKVTLSSAELPSHTHAVSIQQLAATSGSPANAVWATSTVNQYATTAPNAVMDTACLTGAGGTDAHDNMMPFRAITFIIALQGNYPTKS